MIFMSEPFSSCYMAVIDGSLVREALFCRPISYVFIGEFWPILTWLPALAALLALALNRQKWKWRSAFDFSDDPYDIPAEVLS